MKKVYLQSLCNIIFAFCLIGILEEASAQGIPINSSPNVIGSGARAIGMGGAFIAIADDATSASWNPGGLTQLERPEFSMVYSYKYIGEDFESSTHPELKEDYSIDFSQLNYMSFVYPFRRTIKGRNLVLSLNYQAKYDFDRELDFFYRDMSALALGNVLGLHSQVNYKQSGQLASLSPAFGFELTDRLSVGLVLNLWNQSILSNNEWTVDQEEYRTFRTNGQTTRASFSHTVIRKKYKNFEGTNVTLGALYRLGERWQIGFVYNSKFTADVDYEEWWAITRGLGVPGFYYSKRPLKYTFPSSFGVGLAYRFPNDKLTLSFDITRREWDQFVVHDPENRNFMMRKRSGISNLPTAWSPHDPTYTLRLGMEYLFFNPNKPRRAFLPSIRAGLFYDPEPASNRPARWFGLGKGDGSVDNYYGITLGAGCLIKNRVNIDVAYVYRWGDDVRQDTFQLVGTDADVDQHMFYLSTVIYF
ncbi:MAG TPA: outer membrane protein transport protein [Candidatus Hydrogenedens sp.]|nr:outer membrane protein transport protein [Candidatus Hydrogenedens sp.]HOL18954.1 outer membrane protein transport protein [Candidatus Hydrogenedens sp.]HPP58994.1 outer membrane protein transport protein [Candidatus Hydrogenedens sp.]